MRFKVLLFVLFSTVVGIYGQNRNPESPLHTFGHTEHLDSVIAIEAFENNAPGDFQSQGIPHAAIVGRGGKFIIGMGGFVKGVVGMDFGHPIANPDEFITSQIPTGPIEGNGARFNISAQQSQFFVNMVILPGSSHQVGAFVSANFLNGYLPVLQFAYMKYHGFQGGYDYSLFSDPQCGAPAVDFEGPCSSAASPVPGINYVARLGKSKRWSLGMGIELPQTSFTTTEGRTKGVYQRVPDIPIEAKYSWDSGNSWVRVSAILRNLYFRNQITRKNVDKLGYGLHLSGAWYFLDHFTFYYQGVWGKGIGSIIQDTQDEGLDMVPVDGGNSLKPVMLWGGFLAMQYDINNRITCSATYSQLRTYAKEFKGGIDSDGNSTPWSGLYKYAQYVSTNVFYHATSYLDVGLEHIWGRRTDYSGVKAGDNRLQAAVKFSF